MSSARDAAWIHDPDLHIGSYPRRVDGLLPFDVAAMPADLPILLDTTFYISRFQQRVPSAVLNFVQSRNVLHCGVALSELSITGGLLDPADARTPVARDRIKQLLETIDLADCRSPSTAAWAEAGMLSGILARTQLGLATPKKALSPAEQCCQTGRRRELLDDALIS